VAGIDWRIVSIMIGVAMAWSAVLLFAVRWLMTRVIEVIDARFEAVDAAGSALRLELLGQFEDRFTILTLRFDRLEKARSEDVQEIRHIERQLMQLREELPKEYVRREDWIRFAAVIDAKQDTLNEKIERLLERRT